jgi:hypothetical protein
MSTTKYTQTQLDEMSKSFPPPGHPHYMPIEERLKLNEPKEETKMSSAAATKYNELKAKIAEAKKQMEETAKTAFTDMAKEFFANNPTVLAFGWTQYTPYWNDGEPCEFSAHTEYPTVTMLVDGKALTYNCNSGDFTDNDGDEVKTHDAYVRQFKSLGSAIESFVTNGQVVAIDRKANNGAGVVTVDGVRVKTHEEYSNGFDSAEEQVTDFLSNFEDDDLETMFGDHVEIMIARDGTIEVEQYQHD